MMGLGDIHPDERPSRRAGSVINGTSCCMVASGRVNWPFALAVARRRRGGYVGGIPHRLSTGVVGDRGAIRVWLAGYYFYADARLR